jgi:NAD(P)-dependent dehydrogenase (short-subunit alcohol dehydrogenase family)
MGEEEIRFFMEETGQSFEDTKREMSQEVPLKRWGTPEEIADVVAFLAGPQSRYVTGVALPVAGGLAPGL